MTDQQYQALVRSVANGCLELIKKEKGVKQGDNEAGKTKAIYSANANVSS